MPSSPAVSVIARTLRNHRATRCTEHMLTRIDHIGIACLDLDTTVEFYRATYGFEVFHSEVNEEQGVREAMLKINETSDGGASYLQLLEPTRADSAVAQVAGQERRGRPPHRFRHGGRGRRGRGHPRQGRTRPVRGAPTRLDGVADHLPAPEGLPRRADRTGHLGACESPEH